MSVAATCEQCHRKLGTFATASALLTATEEHEPVCPRRTTRGTRLAEGAAS